VRFPGSGSGGIWVIIGLCVQTPWIAYIFLVLLAYCLISALIEKRKLIGFVQVAVGACIPVVIVFKDAQGYGWEYVMIWVFGLFGCVMYWGDRWLIESQQPPSIL
jgi:hypothetical protein